MRTRLRGAPLWMRLGMSIERRGPDECWPFVGHIDGDGYGRIHRGRESFAAHRLAWEVANQKDFPRGKVALHSCDNRRCCNPGHIKPGTIAENNADAHAKRRHAHGERMPQAKLTEAEAVDILRRRRAGESAQALGREFGVSDRLVYLIAAGRKWPHLARESA